MAQGESQLQIKDVSLPTQDTAEGSRVTGTLIPPLWGDAILGTHETGTAVGPA